MNGSQPPKYFISIWFGPLLLWARRKFSAVIYQAERRQISSELGRVGDGFFISNPWDIRGAQHVYIGADVYFGANVLMIADRGAEVHIGNHVMFGPGVTLIAFDHRFDDPAVPIKASGYGTRQNIEIGNDVWVGSGAIILRGVKIESGSIVGAGSVVTKSIGRNEIWAGNPARKVKDRFVV